MVTGEDQIRDELRQRFALVAEALVEQVAASVPVELEEFSGAERVLHEWAGNLARILLEDWGKLANASTPRPGCKKCLTPMRHKGSKSCHIVTTIGVVQVSRPRWRCERCGVDDYPHDTLLRFGGHAISVPLGKLAAWLGALLPFDEARDTLAKHLGVTLSKQSIELVTVEAGLQFLNGNTPMAQKAAETSDRNFPVPNAVCVFADSGEVHVDGCWTTVRVATIVGFDDQSNERFRTTIARILPLEEFGVLLRETARNLGVERAATRAFVADGTNELWEVAELHFSGALQILDWDYLFERVEGVAQEVFPSRSEGATWATRHLDAIWDGNISKVLAALRAEFAKRWPRARRRTVQDFLTFLEANAGRMNYPAYHSLGVPVSAGGGERQAITVVERRCRTPRMRNWRLRSAEAVASLRAAIADGSFDSRWND